MRVLVITGVAREARIAAGPRVDTICSGGSPARLRSLLASHNGAGITAVISFGIGGGLNPGLAPGHVVVADAVVAGGERWATDLAITDALMRVLPSADGLKVLRGTIAGVDLALLDPATKSTNRAQTNAALVDMESHIAADYAARRGLPFAAVRVVCDTADSSLPPLVNEALTPEGAVSLPGVFGSLARHPGQIADLLRLARDSRRAFVALEQAGAVLHAAFAKA